MTRSTRGANLIFVLGKPRSGTTWLLSALEHHPDCLALRPETRGIAVTTPTKETGLFVRGRADDAIEA
ncbi:MAG: sulfotransferase, partial [Candidatus Krumholzibacteriia bacterium]